MDRHVQRAIDSMVEALDHARIRDSSQTRAYRRAIALLLIERDSRDLPTIPSDEPRSYMGERPLGMTAEHKRWLRARALDLRAAFAEDLAAVAGVSREDFWRDVVDGLDLEEIIPGVREPGVPKPEEKLYRISFSMMDYFRAGVMGDVFEEVVDRVRAYAEPIFSEVDDETRQATIVFNAAFGDDREPEEYARMIQEEVVPLLGHTGVTFEQIDRADAGLPVAAQL